MQLRARREFGEGQPSSGRILSKCLFNMGKIFTEFGEFGVLGKYIMCNECTEFKSCLFI
jgi:hypothetical protein